MTDTRAENTRHFLSAVLRALTEAGIATWVFGGWAEELQGLCPTRAHRDIDLLYPAENFDRLDEFLGRHGEVEEVLPKRFVHKRAFRWHGVLCEVFLLQQDAGGHVTDFFGRHRHRWPADTLAHTSLLLDRRVPSASPAALHDYRERHEAVEHAHRQHRGE